MRNLASGLIGFGIALLVMATWPTPSVATSPIGLPQLTASVCAVVVDRFVNVTETPTPIPTLPSWARTATARPTGTRLPLQTPSPTHTPTPSFKSNHPSEGEMADGV